MRYWVFFALLLCFIAESLYASLPETNTTPRDPTTRFLICYLEGIRNVNRRVGGFRGKPLLQAVAEVLNEGKPSVFYYQKLTLLKFAHDMKLMGENSNITPDQMILVAAAKEVDGRIYYLNSPEKLRMIEDALLAVRAEPDECTLDFGQTDKMPTKDQTELLKLYLKGVLKKYNKEESYNSCQTLYQYIAARLGKGYTAEDCRKEIRYLRHNYQQVVQGKSSFLSENQKKILKAMVGIDARRIWLSPHQKARIERVLDEVEADEKISNQPQSSGQLSDHQVTEILIYYLGGAVTLNEKRKNNINLNLCEIVEADSMKIYTAGECIAVIENLRQKLADSANGKTQIPDFQKALMEQTSKIDMNNHVQNPVIDNEIITLLRHSVEYLNTIISSIQNN